MIKSITIENQPVLHKASVANLADIFNGLVGTKFFAPHGYCIYFPNCSNPDFHNKIIYLCGLALSRGDFGMNFVALGRVSIDGQKFAGYITLNEQGVAILYNLFNGMKSNDLKEIKVNIS